MINTESLKHFLELTRTLHMSRAAAHLGVTQPTLSHSLKRLEDEVGYPLFIRSKKGLTLTAAGEKLSSKAQDLQAAWDQVINLVTEDVEEVGGRIRLGCHTAVAQYTLPSILPRLFQAHPKLTMSLTHGLSRHVTELVASRQLDVAIVVNPQPHPDLIIKEIARDQVCLWISSQCKNPEMLLVEPALLQSQDILSKLSKKDIHFTRTLESSSLEVVAQLLTAGVGCAILPERVARAFADAKVTRMKNSPVFEDKICVAYHSEFRKLKRGEVFLKALKEAFGET